ncbi:unnamed protein product [Fusarium equiseti]|uniref:Zn(2)-C6 fungal-type domain-containing protein n=1 Tax=Fusarium equiseti TaxID=61235 RepID=A0A8J2IQU6_FUSEQ|nr:unnamed protein product [Fusarium equiseti]
MPLDTTEPEPEPELEISKTEPLACVSCRARKLKCDRVKPACTRCVKVSNGCVYPESRRKPNFKRRNVKELEARLAQVEDYLKEVNKNSDEKTADGDSIYPTQPDVNFGGVDVPSGLPGLINDLSGPSFSSLPQSAFDQQSNDSNTPFNTQLMSLGLSEPLPPDDVMEELKPPMCLRYVIWALAAAGNNKYDEYHEIFYRRSRQYMEADTMKGHGDVFVSIQHAQTWALVAFYEARMLLFTRSTISVANCVRLCHMMGLDRLDGDHVSMPPALGPPLTWAELEERRRIFWGVFAADSHCCISTGWPTLIDSDDIATRLPASEEAFAQNRKEEAPFLDDAIQGAQYTGFAGTIVTCQINKLILRHVHRSKPDSRCEDLMHGSFWTRHRDLDNTLSSLFMFLPEKFRLPENIRDVSALHLNMNLHAAVICIHHAAVEKAERYKLPDHVKRSSVARLRAAAEEIVNIMRLTSNVTLCFLIIQCMEAIARVHTITRTFLQQTCVDVEKNGLDTVIQMPPLRKHRNAFGPNKSQVPILARTSVANRSGPSLPVYANDRQMEAEQTRLDSVAHAMGISLGKTCYQALLGSAYRNIRPDTTSNKRKRTNESPIPDLVPGTRNSSPLDLNLNPNFKGTGMWPAAFSPRMTSGSMSLPDRTSSSTGSSPINQVSNSGSYTKTVSGSSHTSPDIGLGNSAEENRIDLRAFQDRISTPIWQSTEETLFAQMATNSLGNGGSDPWGILTAVDLNWDAEGLPTGT